jgi:hypothetical protein
MNTDDPKRLKERIANLEILLQAKEIELSDYKEKVEAAGKRIMGILEGNLDLSLYEEDDYDDIRRGT